MQSTISIKDVCGRKTVTRADGGKVNALVRKALEATDCVTIDFNNIRIASVSFLDQAIGILALDHDLVEIQSKLRLENMLDFDERLLKDILTSRALQRRKLRPGGKDRRATRPSTQPRAKRSATRRRTG